MIAAPLSHQVMMHLGAPPRRIHASLLQPGPSGHEREARRGSNTPRHATLSVTLEPNGIAPEVLASDFRTFAVSRVWVRLVEQAARVARRRRQVIESRGRRQVIESREGT